tara:strand:- start:8742 stop:9068 length:327 start_codon:yes stop_codon:yes gene_type:complete
MAKISTYSKDSSLTGNDTVLGTDGDNENVTVNFSLATLANYFNQNDNYTHTQSAAATTWSITHNLGKYPAPIVIDSGGNQVLGQINYTSTNALTITFTSSFSGTAHLS